MQTPCLALAALRLKKALVKRRPGYQISPAEVELIIYLVSALLPMVKECISADSDRILEERAYRFLTIRIPILDWLRRKNKTIRDKAAMKWVQIGGSPELADDIAECVLHESNSLDREYFHNLWAEVRTRNGKSKIIPPQGGSGTVKPNRTDRAG